MGGQLLMTIYICPYGHNIGRIFNHDEQSRFMLEKDEIITIGEIVLRPYRDEDVTDIVENINDEAISRFTLNIAFPYGPRDAEDFRDPRDRP